MPYPLFPPVRFLRSMETSKVNGYYENDLLSMCCHGNAVNLSWFLRSKGTNKVSGYENVLLSMCLSRQRWVAPGPSWLSRRSYEVLCVFPDVNMVADPKPHQTGRKRQNVAKTGNDW